MQRAEQHPIQRMPTVFGPTPGPRQMPDGTLRGPDPEAQRATAWATCPVDRSALTRVLPAQFTPRGAPSLTIQFHSLRNLAWLAGRGYNIVEVSVPVTYLGLPGPQDGAFVLVLWENLADPIISGREELGMSKVFAEISDVHTTDPCGDQDLAAHWGGFEFLHMSVRDLRSGPVIPTAALPRFHHKYVPRTGAWGQADADYIVASPANPVDTRLVATATGTASVSLTRATFDQLPTLLHTVNGLADLKLGPATAAGVTASIGAGTLVDQYAV